MVYYRRHRPRSQTQLDDRPKMENPVTAHKDGVITGLAVEAGAAITQGTVLAEIK